ncbi:hypothetical protein NDU88_010012 [Pleurodeles waltl]|uniref:Uncharacterized protein n=1 Tax=Pleurodeles waltl TaxID=8319 RepID=A0AAV7S018_PLEWA|nr:hypothetical protein NDU88_010012 [Pleurodeles waltl]
MECPACYPWWVRHSILQSETTVGSLETPIASFPQINDAGEVPLASVWEALKLVVRGLIPIVAENNQCRRVKRESLEKEVAELVSTKKHADT